MATLYISEFAAPADVKNRPGLAQIVQQPPLAEQTVTITAASAQSSAFNTETRIIRVHTDTVCSVLIGSNPTATTAKARLAAGQTEYFGVTGGHKIAVIANS